MRLKKREIPTSRREMNVQEGDGVKKMQWCMSKFLYCGLHEKKFTAEPMLKINILSRQNLPAPPPLESNGCPLKG